MTRNPLTPMDILDAYNGFRNFRGAMWLSDDGQNSVLLSSPEDAHYDDEQLRSIAFAEAHNAKFPLEGGKIIIDAWERPVTAAPLPPLTPIEISEAYNGAEFRACLLVGDDGQSSLLLTSPEDAHLSTESLLAKAKAELENAGVGMDGGYLIVDSGSIG